MTNVLALVTFKVFPPQMGGQKGVVHFYDYLKAFVHVFMAVSHNNDMAPAGWTVERLLYANKKMFLNPLVLIRLKTIIRQKGIQVLVAEHSYAGWLAWVLRKMFKIPFVIHSHNIEALRFKQMHRRWWKLYQRYEKWIHQKADHNFFISEEDKVYALQHYQLHTARCTVITYGVEKPTAPPLSKQAWLQAQGLSSGTIILYFNGTLDYKPNYDAAWIIINDLAPVLERKLNSFKLVISGNRAPQVLEERLAQEKHIVYLGFVDDVTALYQIADVFINPVLNTSGVKTKVLEALAANCQVVSTESGARGIRKKVCGSKLTLTDDDNWEQFGDKILKVVQQPKTDIPDAFYDTYLWNNIAQKAALILNKLAQKHAN